MTSTNTIRDTTPRLAAACVTLVAGLVLAGCDGSGAVRAQAESGLARVDAAIDRLGDNLDAGDLRNAQLIRQYAGRIISDKPELRDLAQVLRREATRDGTLYRGLGTRLDDARSALPPEGADRNAYLPVMQELGSLAAAADPTEFNRALSDPLNVLADLSGGTLPRVDAISASASRQANGAANLGPGGQLVGNPHYGQWRSDSSGNSFWVWYGQFALIRDLLGGPRIGYGAWAGGRDYSYYHDYGRSNYTSPTARRQQNQVESTARRKFSSEGRTFQSPYAKRRTGASTGVARQKFASSASRPRSSFASSSSRPATTRTSRASFRGFGGGSRGPSRGK